jgi:hypothetical protein
MANQADWSHCAALMRELGRLQIEAGERTLSEGSSSQLRQHIESAAEAVRRLIDAPGDDDLIVAAWELIVATEALIARVSRATTALPPPTSKELRERAVEARTRAALERESGRPKAR